MWVAMTDAAFAPQLAGSDCAHMLTSSELEARLIGGTSITINF